MSYIALGLAPDSVSKTPAPDSGLPVTLASPLAAVRRVKLRWQRGMADGLRFLGDHWERGYGDLEWRGLVPERPMPWYFLPRI
jgi:alpha-galactosidase